MTLPTVPFFGVDMVTFGVDFVSFYALYLVISLSLNLEFGYTGIPNFGKVLFIAGGAAFAGSFAGRLAAYVYGINIHGDFITFNARIITEVDNLLVNDPVFAVEFVLLSLMIAAIVGAFLGYVSSYPAIRLREDYLGMLLLGAAQFFQVVLRTYTPLIGGSQPIFVPDPYYYWAQVGTGYRDLISAAVIGVFAIVTYVFVERLVRSPLGRTLRAIRDNEDASRALGKDDAVTRRNVLMVASAIAAMAGAFYAFYTASVEYDTWSRFAWTFWPFLIVIIGGAGNNKGVALGALVFTFLFRGLEQVKFAFQPYVFFDVNWLQDLLLAALLIVVLLLRPQGIIKEKPTTTLPRSRVAQLMAVLSSPVASAPVRNTKNGPGYFRWSSIRRGFSARLDRAKDPKNEEVQR